MSHGKKGHSNTHNNGAKARTVTLPGGMMAWIAVLGAEVAGWVKKILGFAIQPATLATAIKAAQTE